MAQITILEMMSRMRQGEQFSFRRFMNTALYSPDGYYNRSVKIGGDGADFYTAALSPLFAYGMANAIVSAWHRLSCPERFQVVELGAGQGELALFISQRLKALLPDTRFEYVIVEKSKMLARIQQKKIREKICQASNSDFLDTWVWGLPRLEIDSVVIGNEVLDAFPVERVRKNETAWERSYISTDCGKDTYQEIFREAPRWLCDVADLLLPIQSGHVSELCLSYPSFARHCALYGRKIEFIFVDYGIYEEELAEGVRPSGTARGYEKHQLCTPWSKPGQIDITADVPWHIIKKVMMKEGFTDISLMKQGEFLMQNDLPSILTELRLQRGNNPLAELKLVAEFKDLCLPGGFGERFQVLTGRRVDG
jgi:NADH dehydrogenase [ubiquinone] 1 alpha subcomplex assembly factor 7